MQVPIHVGIDQNSKRYKLWKSTGHRRLQQVIEQLEPGDAATAALSTLFEYITDSGEGVTVVKQSINVHAYVYMEKVFRWTPDPVTLKKTTKNFGKLSTWLYK